jgi:transitional endoplasmic reticulum ATPase
MKCFPAFEATDGFGRVGSISKIHVVNKLSKEIVALGKNIPIERPSLQSIKPTSTSIPKDASSFPGSEHVFLLLHEIISGAFEQSYLYSQLNVSAPKGVLLFGPPGVGKTYVVAHAARLCTAKLITINATEVLSPYPGQTEASLRDIFREAHEAADSGSRVVMFIDEIDALVPHRSAQENHAFSRIVAQILTLLDGMNSNSSRVVTVAATNRPNAIDPALRRPGRLDREVHIEPPNVIARQSILSSLLKPFPCDQDVQLFLPILAEFTTGYVGADLTALVRDAAQVLTLKASVLHDHLNAPFITKKGLMESLKRIPPSLHRSFELRLGAQGNEENEWDSLGGLDQVKQVLHKSLLFFLTSTRRKLPIHLLFQSL